MLTNLSKSHSGCVMFAAGGPFLWKSSRQPIVTLSSTGAEYVALTMAVREGLTIQHLLKELTYRRPDTKPLAIFADNTNTISNAGGGRVICGQSNTSMCATALSSRRWKITP